MKTSFKTLLQRGAKPIGTWSDGHSATVVEVMGIAGFDFIFLDNEHGFHNAPNAVELVRTAECAGIVPIIRVPGPGYEDCIKKALDMGAAGVLVPNVTDAASAGLAVRHAKFAPVGSRGCCPYLRSNDYGIKYGTVNYYAKANEEASVILLMENREALDHFEDILAVEGVDSVFIGPVDLSVSLGVPGELDHPTMRDALEYMVETARKRRMPVGLFCESEEKVRRWMPRVDYITNGGDVGTLLQASMRQLKLYRGV